MLQPDQINMTAFFWHFVKVTYHVYATVQPYIGQKTFYKVQQHMVMFNWSPGIQKRDDFHLKATVNKRRKKCNEY